MIKNFIFLSFLVLWSCLIYSNECEEKVHDVYNKLINSIGNNFPYPPDLIIVNEERNVAYISDKGIVIEKKLINLFCGQNNFDDKIAYVLSHELAHHYLNHSWMRNTSLGYASSIGDFVQKNAISREQRKLAETSADLFGGFFGQISGYNVLGYGKEVLSKIYEEYGISKEIIGYPSLDERFEIIDSKVDEARSLEKLFDIGNVFLRFGEFEIAKDCFEDILKNNFTSREIYNNLGTVYLLYGITIMDNNIARLKFPVNIDYMTRAKTGLSRSADLFNDSKKMLENAKFLFEKSLSLDNTYIPAKQNLTILKFLDLYSIKKIKDFFNSTEYKNLNEEVQFDLKIISMILEGKKSKKIEKLINKGSQRSFHNFYNSNHQPKSNFNVFSEFKIDESVKIFGIERPFKSLNTNYGDLSFKYKKEENYIIYEIGDKYLVETSLDSLNKDEGLVYNDRIFYFIE